MYVSFRNLPVDRRAGSRSRRAAVPRTVVLLGLTSLFTDISSEMLTAVLPVFLVLQLGLSPAQFGLVDGLYRGVAGVSTMAAGVLSDWLRRPKLVASVGYGLSAVTRPMLLLASTAVGVAGLISVDRVGKGIRTAPRDAMIATASHPSDLGYNFGVHRALDTIGAMLGPLVAFGVLMLVPGQFDAVFVVSAAFGFVGLAVLVLLVPGHPPSAAPRAAPTAATAAAPSRPRLTRTDLTALLHSRAFVRRVGLAGLLTVFTVSDAFVFLALLDRDENLARVFPLLAVGLALAYTVFAVPVGRVADRWGRMRVYLAGHVALLGVYAVVVGSLGTVATAVVALLLMGLYYAATDGVLAAAVSATLPEVSRASGLSLARTVVAVAAFVSSVGFGLLSGRWGADLAYLLMGLGLAVAVGAAVTLVRRSTPPAVLP
ncbi:major facilitator transporter [Knoellia aerolata DSM 18566]|uniref:Major facilitator transporter n=1 Tax=Knoellia aerolata DSM 18566 TaxID=1385519 RepID=A0A0A0JYT3_9MICO|nr:major facilitator transporter [Knoellia aerolata DSM 18566]